MHPVIYYSQAVTFDEIFTALNGPLCVDVDVPLRNYYHCDFSQAERRLCRLYSGPLQVYSATVEASSFFGSSVNIRLWTYVRYCRSAMAQKLFSTGPGSFRRAERKETRNSCTGRSPVQGIGHVRSCRRRVAAYRIERTWRSQKCKYLRCL